MPALPLRLLVQLAWYVIGRLAELALLHSPPTHASTRVSVAPAGGPGPRPRGPGGRPLVVRVPAPRRAPAVDAA